MKKIDYNQLYNLLYSMNKVQNLNQLSENIYCSVSKCSKMIKDYETRLKVQLYAKSEGCILSKDGKLLLAQIEQPIVELNKIIKIESDLIGIDENLIEELSDDLSDYRKHYTDCKQLLEMYKSGQLDKIIVSSDFEDEFEFNSKQFIADKKIYHIKHKTDQGQYVYANAYGCPIRKKLEVSKMKIDETLTQSIAICKMVRVAKGEGYTFSVDMLDPKLIDIKIVDELAVSFFLYTKY